MSVEFVCRNCSTRFAVEEGEKARCPSCLRVHGVDSGEEQGEAAEHKVAVAAPKASRVPLLIAVVVLGLGAGGYFLWRAQQDRGRGSEGTAGGGKSAGGAGIAASGASKALVEALRKAGISDESIVAAVGESSALAAKAKDLLAGKTAAGEQASALWGLGESWRKGLGQKPGFEGLLRKQIVRGAPKAFDDLAAAAPGEFYALEVAAALLSVARAGGVSAWAMELGTGEGPIRSEASPQLANIGVAVYPAGDKTAKPFVIDVVAGKVVEGGLGRRLEDAQLAAHFYVARAGYFFLRSEGSRANRESEWAMKLDEESPAVAASRGIVLMAFGQVDQAVTQMRRATERGGAAGRWQVILCLGLLRAERGDDALEACKKGVEKEPGATGAHLALGYAYLAVGEVDKALETVEGARKIDETDAEVHKALAQVFDQKGDVEKAKGALEQALRLDPKVRGVHLLRGLMAMKGMDYDGAADGLRKEVEVDPENERLRAILATTLFRGGKKPEAEKVLSELRALSKDATMTEQLIATVRKEVADDDDDEKTDGGAEDEDGKADGGQQREGTPAGGGAATGGTGIPTPGATSPEAAAKGQRGKAAPGARDDASDDEKDDDKDDDKGDGKDEVAPKSSGGFDLQKPGESKAPSRFFDLGKKP